MNPLVPRSWHPGLTAAVIMAGGPVALGKIIGKTHSYVTYRMRNGRGLEADHAQLVCNVLGIRYSKLLDKPKDK